MSGEPDTEDGGALSPDATVSQVLRWDSVPKNAHRDGWRGFCEVGGQNTEVLVRRPTQLLATSLFFSFLVASCAVGDDPLDDEHASFASGKADGATEPGSPEALAVLALVNDPLVTFEELDIDAALNARAARNIIDHRNGPDGLVESADDDPFDTLQELDDVPYVGPVALATLIEYAIAQGYLEGLEQRSVDVVFSPQPYDQSHTARVAALIDAAQHSIDIAMYSYSDARIADALEAAVDRGVKVRFVFETANEDRKQTGSALEATKSARLEKLGINVRYVNKIMHHKFMILDGPRDVIDRADTCTIVSGSGNWSYGAAAIYDENTLFVTGYRELALRLQSEFNLMWEHSRDFVWDATLPYELSTLALQDSDIQDDPTTDAHFTSDNFSVSSTTFRKTGENNVSDQWVAAIDSAEQSIRIASGHLRSRPIAEALMAKIAAHPEMDIRIYLDDQEYISDWYHAEQLSEYDACLAEAETEAQIRNCTDKGFYFGYEVGQAGGGVRYKYYAYRWHYSYAEQMHHKYMIIDGDELWTGSYNLSDNAEHNTFENVLVFRGPEFAPLVASYADNFERLWNTGRSEGLLADLSAEISTADVIPIVFDPMALTWQEVTDLKELIRDNCDDINSDPFRDEPENHRVCYR